MTKKLCAGLVAVGLLTVSVATHAATVDATFNTLLGGNATAVLTPGGSHGGGGGAFYFTRTGGTFTGTLLPSATPLGAFIGFCLEVNENISYGQSASWTVKDLASAPADANNLLPSGMGATKADKIALLFGHVLPIFSDAAVGALGANGALALQLALWEIVFETDAALNLATGNAKFSANSTPFNTAQGYLTALNAGTYQTRATGLLALTRDGTQDYLVQTPVPLPAAAWLLFSGLAGLGVVGRRRTKA